MSVRTIKNWINIIRGILDDVESLSKEYAYSEAARVAERIDRASDELWKDIYRTISQQNKL